MKETREVLYEKIITVEVNNATNNNVFWYSKQKGERFKVSPSGDSENWYDVIEGYAKGYSILKADCKIIKK